MRCQGKYRHNAKLFWLQFLVLLVVIGLGIGGAIILDPSNEHLIKTDPRNISDLDPHNQGTITAFFSQCSALMTLLVILTV